jgi:hypothetical protein
VEDVEGIRAEQQLAGGGPGTDPDHDQRPAVVFTALDDVLRRAVPAHVVVGRVVDPFGGETLLDGPDGLCSGERLLRALAAPSDRGMKNDDPLPAQFRLGDGAIDAA